MLQNEKEKLIALLDDQRRWCQEAEARDDEGNPARYDDENAAAWDIVGGMCHLFGWRRARQLFGQVCRHLVGRPRCQPSSDPEMAAMASLQDFNDERGTTYELIMARLQEMPVWRRNHAGLENPRLKRGCPPESVPE